MFESQANEQTYQMFALYTTMFDRTVCSLQVKWQ